MRAALIVVAMVLGADVAAADPEPAHKSGGVALALPVVGTVGLWGAAFGIGMADFDCARDQSCNDTELAIVAGLAVIAPSAGHFYVGENRHGVIASGARAVAAAAWIWGGQSVCEPSPGECLSRRHRNGTVEAAGGFLLLGLTVYDWIDAPFAARRFNRRAATVALAPTALRAVDGPAWGLAAAGTF